MPPCRSFRKHNKYHNCETYSRERDLSASLLNVHFVGGCILLFSMSLDLARYSQKENDCKIIQNTDNYL